MGRLELVESTSTTTLLAPSTHDRTWTLPILVYRYETPRELFIVRAQQIILEKSAIVRILRTGYATAYCLLVPAVLQQQY